MLYTAVTFAPVQGFILASRKLRDLYGSSLLISHLARALAEDVERQGLTVISPADFMGSRGVPNVLVIEGDYSREQASKALLSCWQQVLTTCRELTETSINKVQPQQQFNWDRSWRACGLHSWEIFQGQGSTIHEAREVLAVNKQQRDWTVPNWTGESSTLSSADAVVWPQMGAVRDPRELPSGRITEEARGFLRTLRRSPDLGIAFAGDNEEISITELVKRLITYPAVARKALAMDQTQLSNESLSALLPERFQRTSMRSQEDAAAETNKPEAIVWFMADGDGIGSHLESLAATKGEAEALRSFSAAMRRWASSLYQLIPKRIPDRAMVVYAGGDDLFGALHESEPGKQDLSTDVLWQWLRVFPELWKQCEQPNLTVSMGLVWADAAVPQREALHHAREAEASAKTRGKNRFALRLLYANGNHLEWTCPWAWLDPILTSYRDREGRTHRNDQIDHASGDHQAPRWRHLAEDLHWLNRRQAIGHAEAEASARALWDAYFPGCELPTEATASSPTDPPPFRASLASPEQNRRFDQWLWDLGRVMAGLEKYRPKRAVQGAQP